MSFKPALQLELIKSWLATKPPKFKLGRPFVGEDNPLVTYLREVRELGTLTVNINWYAVWAYDKNTFIVENFDPELDKDLIELNLMISKGWEDVTAGLLLKYIQLIQTTNS